MGVKGTSKLLPCQQKAKTAYYEKTKDSPKRKEQMAQAAKKYHEKTKDSPERKAQMKAAFARYKAARRTEALEQEPVLNIDILKIDDGKTV
jgi:hypothetical protein